MDILNRIFSQHASPFVIAEIGINHEGDYNKAVQMVMDAHSSGCECVKFQCHVIDDEMIFNTVVPGNTNESIWDIMNRCALSEEEEINLKKLVESLGMAYLSTPFSRRAAIRLESMGVSAYKIGSGECNNYPLVKHIAGYGKPIILSTGMNNIESIRKSVSIIEDKNVPYVLMHCTSMYPTPYDKVHLGALAQLKAEFPNARIGLSDHSLNNWAAFAAVALGATVVEKHFTSSLDWSGPDISISITPAQLSDLISGCNAISQALGGGKHVLPEEAATINFAYASVVTTQAIKRGDPLTRDNIWVKRPGTGDFLAEDYEQLLGKVVIEDIASDTQVKKEHLGL